MGGGFSFSFRLPVWDVLPLPQEGYGSLEDTERAWLCGNLTVDSPGWETKIRLGAGLRLKEGA